MSLFFGNRGTEIYKLEDEKNIVSKFEKGKQIMNYVWEYENIGKLSKRTREQGPPPPGRPSVLLLNYLCIERRTGEVTPTEEFVVH